MASLVDIWTSFMVCVFMFLWCSYLMQWAAVMTQLAAIREPPQVCLHTPSLSYCREIWRQQSTRRLKILYIMGKRFVDLIQKQLLEFSAIRQCHVVYQQICKHCSIPARASCGAWHLLRWPHEKLVAQWVVYRTQELHKEDVNHR